MCRQHAQVQWWAIIVALLVAITWGTSGCGPRPPQVEIVVSPSISTLEVGEKLTLSANATGQELKYQWKLAGPGKLLEPTTDLAVVYEATELGNVVVTVEVRDKSGQMTTKSYSFVVEPSTEVVERPTDTPTPTPETTPTVALPPECQSFRPPLKGAADFAGKVEIMTPNNCTTGLPTETNITVAGTYEGIPDDVDIWVLVYSPNLVYYPQSPNSCEGVKLPKGGGRWQGQATLGLKGGDPEWFDIVVVLTDQETSLFFIDWHLQGCQSGYKGISADELEQRKITEKGYITVQTQD